MFRAIRDYGRRTDVRLVWLVIQVVLYSLTMIYFANSGEPVAYQRF